MENSNTVPTYDQMRFLNTTDAGHIRTILEFMRYTNTFEGAQCIPKRKRREYPEHPLLKKIKSDKLIQERSTNFSRETSQADQYRHTD